MGACWRAVGRSTQAFGISRYEFLPARIYAMSEFESYEKRIREICPEIVIESVSLNREGLLNDVVIVNGELVFRFAKRDFGFKDPKEEANILHLLRKYITLPIPTPFYESQEVLAYRLIPG